MVSDNNSFLEFYRSALLSSVPRILSELDRDVSSVNYGCFDREYWAWITKDFSNIDAQRMVYPLALLWKTEFHGNIYHRNEQIKKWIIAGILFWCKKQNRDGSFDHLYPFEHSFVGAAFTLYEIAETYKIILDTLTP